MLLEVNNSVTVGHSKSVEVVVFSPEGEYLASGSWDRTAILWDREVSKV